MAKLTLRVEPHLGEPFSHKLEGDALVLGRSSKADLVIPDRYISRLQARLFRDGERWMVEDLGSRNPTLLNGQAVSRPTIMAFPRLEYASTQSGFAARALRYDSAASAGLPSRARHMPRLFHADGSEVRILRTSR